jgi:hypothetical protein
VIDLTASQLTNTGSIDTTVQELEDILDRRLTSPEIQVDMIVKNHLFCFFWSSVSNRSTNP